jgi:hypothetical protein
LLKLGQNTVSLTNNSQITATNLVAEYPSLEGNLGCADAIRALLASEWGRKDPRNEAELTAAMRANALHFPHGTIAGLLNALTKRGQLRRVGKKNGAYAYAIVPRNNVSKEERQVFATA